MDYYRGHYCAMILSLLKDGDSYGYQLNSQIAELTDNEVQLTEATLYTTLKELLDNGSITSYMGEGINNVKRKYYSITSKGIEYLDDYKIEWLKSIDNIGKILGGKKND